MTVRLYRHRIIRVPLTSEWLFQAESFAATYAKIKPSDPDQEQRLARWAESWWLCTRAFTWYFEGDFDYIEQRTLKSGWTPSEVLRVGTNQYHLTTGQVSEQYNFGPTCTGTVPKGLLPRSKANVFVLSCLVVPDVDIIGWIAREDLEKHLEGKRYILRETQVNSMKEAPGLARRDKRDWYI